MYEPQDRVPMTSCTSDGLITAREVCELVGMKPSWVYELAAQGGIPSYAMGRAIRFRRADVDAFVESRRKQIPARDASGSSRFVPRLGRGA